jgi:hypothetical protein
MTGEIYNVNVSSPQATSCKCVIDGTGYLFTAYEGLKDKADGWYGYYCWRVVGYLEGLIPGKDNIKFDGVLNAKLGKLKITHKRSV